MVDVQPVDCVGLFLQAVLSQVSTEADRDAVFNLRPLLRTLGLDQNGYFYRPTDENRVSGAEAASVTAPYGADPLRGILLQNLGLLRRCEDEFVVPRLRDLCREDIPPEVRRVRVRALVYARVGSLEAELRRFTDAAIGGDIARLLFYAGQLEDEVVAALTTGRVALEAGDAGSAREALRTALRLMERPEGPELNVRNVE